MMNFSTVSLKDKNRLSINDQLVLQYFLIEDLFVDIVIKLFVNITVKIFILYRLPECYVNEN